MPSNNRTWHVGDTSFTLNLFIRDAPLYFNGGAGSLNKIDSRMEEKQQLHPHTKDLQKTTCPARLWKNLLPLEV